MSNVKVINVSVAVTHKGQMYPGVTIYPGVDIAFVDACAPTGKAVQFSNCDAEIAANVKPLAAMISNAENVDVKYACAKFLQIKALA